MFDVADLVTFGFGNGGFSMKGKSMSFAFAGEFGHMVRWGCAVLAAAGMLLGGAPVFASGRLEVIILASGKASVTLTAPDGTAVTAVSDTGELTLRPRTPGVHMLSITVGDRTETAEIEVPGRGPGRVIYDPEGTPKIRFNVGFVEEVTVTAQRVEENVQEIPVSVTAFTPAEIEEWHILNVQETSQSTPNMWMEKNNATSSGGRVILRGVGEDAKFFTSDPQVGIYIDDIYIPRQDGAQFDLYDLERLEVLRGPQGTLFGRNTSAGAIRFVTQKPGSEFQTHLEGTLGQYSQTDFRGAVNVPLSQKAAFRIAGMIRQHDGYSTDRANEFRSGGDRDVNDQDIWGARVSLRWTPSSRVNILFIGDYLQERSTPGFATGFVDQSPLGPTGYGTGEWDLTQDLDGDGDPRTMESDLETWINDIDQWGVSGTVTWQMSNRLTFKSITGYRELTNLLLLDADGRTGNELVPDGLGPTYHLYENQAQNQFSQELQILGSAGARNQISYIAGLYYFHEENAQRTENIILAPQGDNRFWDTTLDTDSLAAFGSATFGVGRNVNITAGARYTWDKKVFDTEVFSPGGLPYPENPTTLLACVAPDGTVVGSTRPCTAEELALGYVDTPVQKHLDPTFDAFTPRVAVDYKAKEDLLVYGSASRGFKSGGFDGRANSGAAVLPLEPIPPETLWSYEIGMKSEWFKNRFRLNVAAFLNDWNDLQGTGTDPDGNIVRLSIGDVETKGLEFEARAIPIERLELTGMLALLRTRYKTVNFDQQVLCYLNNTGDEELVLKYSPDTSYHVSALYTTTETLGGRFSFGGSMSGKSKYYLSACNNEGGSQDGYTLVHAFLAYETRNGLWRVSANGENLTDEVYLTGALYSAGLRMSPGFLNPPRRFSLSLRFSY